jgi:serine/threonine protein kinase
MGAILFVTPLKDTPGFRTVLKYCCDINEEPLKRFRREVRLLATFKGNSKVVQILNHDLDHDPPYFVMKYYPEGDLCKLTASRVF